MNTSLSYCVEDIRFPTSSEFIGSDSVHIDPNYSAVYLTVKTCTNHEGHGLTFTIGRGNEICKKNSRIFNGSGDTFGDSCDY
jgi:L-fuconate dehydratase